MTKVHPDISKIDDNASQAAQRKAQLILASASPRRSELLRTLSYRFKIHPSSYNEACRPKLLPADLVEFLAQAKAEAVWKELDCTERENSIILAADTIVCLDSVILEKPRNADEAISMLKQLSGRVHHVYSGVCLQHTSNSHCFYDSSLVEFYPLEDDEIKAYVASGEPMDKAGAYGIQGAGRFLVRRIEGSYDTIIGLPLARVYRELKTLCKAAGFKHQSLFEIETDYRQA